MTWQDDGMFGNRYISFGLRLVLKSVYVIVLDLWEVGVWKCRYFIGFIACFETCGRFHCSCKLEMVEFTMVFSI